MWESGRWKHLPIVSDVVSQKPLWSRRQELIDAEKEKFSLTTSVKTNTSPMVVWSSSSSSSSVSSFSSRLNSARLCMLPPPGRAATVCPLQFPCWVLAFQTPDVLTPQSLSSGCRHGDTRPRSGSQPGGFSSLAVITN